MNDCIDWVISGIEFDIEKFETEKEEAKERDDLERALCLSWTVAGLQRAISRLRIIQRTVSQETKENNG